MAEHNQRLQIWAISRHYHPTFSGAAIQAHWVLKELVRQGFSVTVLTPSDYDARHLRGKTLERDGITIKYLSTIPFNSWNPLAQFPFLRRIVVYFTSRLTLLSTAISCAWILWRKGKLNDIVQFYSINECSMIPVWLARTKGMHPVVRMSLLGSDDDPGAVIERVKRGNIIAGLTLGTFRRAEAVIGPSSALTSSCQAAGLNPDKVLRIPNGVDLHMFRTVSSGEKVNLRKTLGLAVDRHYIIFVGAAIYRKGIDVLVKAFIQVARQVDGVELLVVGRCKFSDRPHFSASTDQQLVDVLRAKLTRAGCALRVHWVGLVDNVNEYLQAADIFCFPTRREGLPNVVGEAMAVGLPIVVSRIEGITTDFLQTEAEGILVSGYDPDDYAAVLLRLLKEPDRAKAMGNAARSQAISEYSLEQVARRYAQLYESISRPRPCVAQVGKTRESDP